MCVQHLVAGGWSVRSCFFDRDSTVDRPRTRRIQIRVCLSLVAVRLFSSVRFEKFGREIFDSSFIIQQQQPIRVGPSCARPFGHGRPSARPSYGPQRPPLSELLPSVLWRCVVVVSYCGHAIRRIIMLCHLRRHGRLSTFHR